jgi:hypothetical protein
VKCVRMVATSRRVILTAVLVSLVWLNPVDGVGATNHFIPVADTSLLEVSPANNLGGFSGMNSGTTQNGPRNRALLRFDLSGLPTNTVIQSAKLTVHATQQPIDGYDFTAFGLHRMFRPWGEGNKIPVTQPGQGVPATEGEATWLHSFYPTNQWAEPGGQPGTDYSSIESSFEIIYDVAGSPYIFPSTPELVDDVQAWINKPATNHGWMFRCADELPRFTARRFGTREDANNAPVLELKYLVPPLLKISPTNNSQVAIRFTAWAGHSYNVFYRNSLKTGSWRALTSIASSATNREIVLFEATAAGQKNSRYRFYNQRYYRVSAQ